MGLDMYLSAERYVSPYTDGDTFETLTEVVGAILPGMNKTYGVSVSVNVAYWRKANAVHRWFVEHVQDGKDDCGEYEVTLGKLIELRDLAQKILDTADWGEPVTDDQDFFGPVTSHPNATFDQTLAHSLLPAQSGFFFGSTEYDEYYLSDMKLTVESLTTIIDNYRDRPVTLKYMSSW